MPRARPCCGRSVSSSRVCRRRTVKTRELLLSRCLLSLGVGPLGGRPAASCAGGCWVVRGSQPRPLSPCSCEG